MIAQHDTAPKRRIATAVISVAVAFALLGIVAFAMRTAFATAQEPKKEDPKDVDPDKKKMKAPEFPEKLDWLNTAGPVKMADLKGKVVLLDFWTLCCINCIHCLPDLAKLEKKYPNELVVIGVHSAKFDSEKITKNIRKAILRYEIAHPVVNDGEHGIWDSFGVSSWPTMVLIDTEGNIVGAISGEGNYEILDKAIAKLIEDGKTKKTLNDKPIRFDLVRFREKGDTPLFFPGKVLADEAGKRLFIADSTHHRIVVTDLDGKLITTIGTGMPGMKNGKFDEAQFDDPQGMAIVEDRLYIADRKNHCIRMAHLKAGQVVTVAGTGKQDSQGRFNENPVGAEKIGLNSPWDILIFDKNKMFIAMAGHHQIWVMDLDAKTVQPYAGDGGENLKDGPLYASRFAQPSGLATDGKFLYVADSEISAIRKVPTNGEGRVETLIGEGLFEFGDKDGIGNAARIQHALAVAFHDGKVIVADTYNNKLKALDPKTREIKTILGGTEPGLKEDYFNEPAGMSKAGNKLYIADTNNHRIRVVDLTTNKVTTLTLTGVEPPPPQKDWVEPKK